MPSVPDTTCRSCGNTHQRHYCPNCGEKRFDPHALSLRHFFEESLEGLFHFDTKILRTLRTLVRHPGKLSLDHVEGRRVGALRPLPLFLIINLIAFVLLFSNPFSLPLENFVTYRPFVDYNTVSQVNAKVAALGTTPEVFAQRFNDAMHRSSKAWLVLLIPVYAVLFGVLFLPKRRRVVEHLVFATHYVSFVLIALPVILVLVAVPMELIFNSNGASGFSEGYDQAVVAVFTLTFIGHLYFAMRRFYHVGMFYALAGAVLVGGGFFGVLQFYRMLLFHVVMHGLS